jgi:hypothetical protein
METALFIEELEEFGICLCPPEIHISDLEVAPDWKDNISSE